MSVRPEEFDQQWPDRPTRRLPRLPRRQPRPGTDMLGEWVNGLRPTGCDDPEHEQLRARAETAEAELRDAAERIYDANLEAAEMEAQRDAAQQQLAEHLKHSIPLNGKTEWTEVAPAPPEQPLPQPVADTWQPPPVTDWDEWERRYDAIRDGEVPEGARGTGGDWPDVPGDKGADVPERIEVGE